MRPSAFFLSACLLLPVAGSAHANGILADRTAAPPSAVDVQAAVAVTPFGTTRWSRITLEGHARVMWLVPARPGAAVDWSSDAWLDALEDATAPRVLRPTSPAPSCDLPRYGSVERVPLWGGVGTKLAPKEITVATSEASLREHAGQRGFVVPPDLDARISSLYSRGWVLLSVELDAHGAVTTSPTIRVSDDGSAALPFALTGGTFADTRLTVFTLTNGPATITGAAELDATTLTWRAEGSDYRERRRAMLDRHRWIRESSTREALFAGVSLPGEPSVAPAMRTYFEAVAASGSGACVEAARAAAKSTGVVARTCAPGAAARVPGGSACTPSTAGIDASAFACGNADDLALALAGTAPEDVFVTRFAGRVPRGATGEDAELSTSDSSLPSVLTAGAWERCPPPSPEPTPPPASRAPPFTGGGRATWIPPAVEKEEETSSSEGCGGGIAYLFYEDTSYEEDESAEGCSSSTGSSDEDEEYEEDAEEGDDSADESDSDDGSYDGDFGSDDGAYEGDTEWWGESASTASKAARKTKLAKVGTRKRVEKRRESPVSRVALLLGALVLPLRRRRRLDDHPPIY